MDHAVRRRHAVPNASLPTITLIFLNIGFIIGGAITVETVFSYPGLGLLTFEAITEQDFVLMQALFLVFTVSVIVFNIVADIADRAARPEDPDVTAADAPPPPPTPLRPARASPGHGAGRRLRASCGRTRSTGGPAWAWASCCCFALGRADRAAAVPLRHARHHRDARERGNGATEQRVLARHRRERPLGAGRAGLGRARLAHGGPRCVADLDGARHARSGSPAGTTAASFGSALQRLTDWFLVIPFIPLVVVLAAVLGQRGLGAIVLVLGVTSWPGTARLVRAQTLSVEGRPYLERARVLGGSDWHQMTPAHPAERDAAGPRQHDAHRRDRHPLARRRWRSSGSATRSSTRGAPCWTRPPTPARPRPGRGGTCLPPGHLRDPRGAGLHAHRPGARGSRSTHD